MRCFVTRDLPGTALDRLRADHDVDVWPDRLPPPLDELRARSGAADAVLSLLTDPIDAAFFEACPSVRAVANYAVGVDNVDVAAATERGIQVGNTPGVLTDATADLTLALMLALMRRVLDGDRAVRAGEWLTWEPGFLLGRDLHGASVVVIGLGRIGQAVARRVEAFGAQVVPCGRDDDPLELIAAADVVTIHAPLTAATRGLIDAAVLKAMKPTAYLVNAARGPIVDQPALLAALQAGEIAGAALDVTVPEPLPADDPLLGAPNLIVVPHIASATHATRGAMADLAVDNLLAALRGEPMPHCVNPEAVSRRP